MPTNPNMVAIQTVTVGSGGAANIEFTSIPQTYTDLVVKVSARATVDETQLELQFNGSTSGYSIRRLTGDGSNVASASLSSVSVMQFGRGSSSTQTASTFGNTEIYIPNYTSSNNKSTSSDGVNENNATSANTYLGAGLWANSAAISSIKIFFNTGNFAQYSTATLYGVTSSAYGAKATGGIITSDANYYYHTFLASDTFTPTQSLSCDYLVVAGGGGGGAEGGGGGGAGGFRTSIGGSALSLTAQAYTVTVGGGGAGAASNSARGSKGSNSVFSTITSTGGGGGGSSGAGVQSGQAGGSGGGSRSNTNTAGGAGNEGGYSPVEGYAGGTTTGSSGSGGGGGASQAGAVGGSTAQGGNGGNGSSSSISGISVTYAGGGGGASNSAGPGDTGGTGGTGGGGNGGNSSGNSTAGTVNTGGGGGGEAGNGAGSPQAGGSGIVIVRYSK